MRKGIVEIAKTVFSNFRIQRNRREIIFYNKK